MTAEQETRWLDALVREREMREAFEGAAADLAQANVAEVKALRTVIAVQERARAARDARLAAVEALLTDARARQVTIDPDDLQTALEGRTTVPPLRMPAHKIVGLKPGEIGYGDECPGATEDGYAMILSGALHCNYCGHVTDGLLR